MSINNRCAKCRRPKWSLGKPNPLRIGDIVTLPKDFTYGRRRFEIIGKFKDKSFKLKFLGGNEKGETIEQYEWWDLKKITSKEGK